MWRARRAAPVGSVFSAVVQSRRSRSRLLVDSIVTAVGMTDHIPIMAVAVIAGSPLMLVAGEAAVALHRRQSTS